MENNFFKIFINKLESLQDGPILGNFDYNRTVHSIDNGEMKHAIRQSALDSLLEFILPILVEKFDTKKELCICVNNNEELENSHGERQGLKDKDIEMAQQVFDEQKEIYFSQLGLEF